MSRITQTLGFSVPPALVKQVERIAKAEQRTKSELFREMLRVYSRYREQRERDEYRWVANVIEEAKAEEVAKPMGGADLLRESARLMQLGKRQAKSLGIKADLKTANRIVHEGRKARRA